MPFRLASAGQWTALRQAALVPCCLPALAALLRCARPHAVSLSSRAAHPVLVTLPVPCLVGGCGTLAPQVPTGQSCGVAGMAGWGSARPRERPGLGPPGTCTPG